MKESNKKYTYFIKWTEIEYIPTIIRFLFQFTF